MEQDIASYLFRNHYCVLPGIGKLTLITNPAETDFINGQIKSPAQKIIFSKEDNGGVVFNELSAVSEHLKMTLETKRTILLNGVGTFSLNDNNEITFVPQPINSALEQPVVFERALRHDATHSILIGDKETTKIIKPEPLSDEIIIKKERWWIAAMVACVIAIGVIVLALNQNIPGNMGSGNQIKIDVNPEMPTYKSVK